MLEQSTYIYGIEAMANNCPENGNITISFLVNNGNIKKTTLTKSEEIFIEKPESKTDAEAEVFTDEFKARIFRDIANTRLQFGTITISVDTKYGELKNYSVIPAFTLNKNLLEAEMKHHENKQKTKTCKVA